MRVTSKSGDLPILINCPNITAGKLLSICDGEALGPTNQVWFSVRAVDLHRGYSCSHWIINCWRIHILTDPSTIIGPHYQEIGKLYVVQDRRSTESEASKLWKGRSDRSGVDWDHLTVISPKLHMQVFCQSSLEPFLGGCQFFHLVFKQLFFFYFFLFQERAAKQAMNTKR